MKPRNKNFGGSGRRHYWQYKQNPRETFFLDSLCAFSLFFLSIFVRSMLSREEGKGIKPRISKHVLRKEKKKENTKCTVRTHTSCSI
jgi:hypothetical protein